MISQMNTAACLRFISRRGLRVARLPFARLCIAIVAIVAVLDLLHLFRIAAGIRAHSVADGLMGALTIAAVIAVYRLYVCLLEQRPATELETRGAAREFVVGVLVGCALFCVTMGMLWLSGVATFAPGSGWSALGYPLVSALVAAVVEEILFRGIVFRIIEESLGTWIALAISAAIFGALHAFNPGASVISSVAIALEAGVLLAAAYVYTRRLWMVIGLHAAWNFSEGGVFGASVSGHAANGLLSTRLHGPDLLTGAGFGPEASVVAVLVCLGAAVFFIALAIGKGGIVEPFWRRPGPPSCMAGCAPLAR
jgi:membrane protease YdiL (CAAX protease family)